MKTTDFARLEEALLTLRERGWFAESIYWCCQSCGFSAAPNDRAITFYHDQDYESSFDENGKLIEPLFLAHDPQTKLTGKTSQEIVEVLTGVNFFVEWDGKQERRIEVLTEETREVSRKYAESRELAQVKKTAQCRRLDEVMSRGKGRDPVTGLFKRNTELNE